MIILLLTLLPCSTSGNNIAVGRGTSELQDSPGLPVPGVKKSMTVLRGVGLPLKSSSYHPLHNLLPHTSITAPQPGRVLVRGLWLNTWPQDRGMLWEQLKQEDLCMTCDPFTL